MANTHRSAPLPGSRLAEVLFKLSQAKSDQRQTLAKVSGKNAEIAQGLIEVAKKLLENNYTDEAAGLVGLTQELLDNDKELQIVVSTILSSKD